METESQNIQNVDSGSIDSVMKESDSIPNSPKPSSPSSTNVSPSKTFITAACTPVSASKLSIAASSSKVSLAPSVEWLDAYSEIYTDTAEADIGVVSDDDDVDGDATLKAMGSCGQDSSQLTRRHAARAMSSRSQMSHRRVPSDMSDYDFPKLDLLYGPHLKFLHEEVGETPDENDLFPSTPLDEDQLKHYNAQEELGSVVINQINDGDQEMAWSDIPWSDPRWLDIRPLMYNAAENAEVFAVNMWKKFQSWKVVGFSNLPQFLQDNDFLKKGHRPPLPSFRECFASIFRIHTETGNIWTHLLGVVAFIGLSLYFITRPSYEIDHQEKAVFMAFFAGAIVCLGLSFTYHTVCCHQNRFIGKLFAKFDYCGIAFLTVGSFVPWLYYSFYCNYLTKVVYMSVVIVLGILAVVVSLWDKFGTPRYRPYRALVFIVFGLSGIAPATHYAVENGLERSVSEASLGWLIFMGALYITGALFYAFRIPERFFPGKVDIWFHSHQIFHCFVIAGAFVHYHGISNMAIYRLQAGECPMPHVDLQAYRYK